MADILLGIDNNLIVIDNSFISLSDSVLQNEIITSKEEQQITKNDNKQ